MKINEVISEAGFFKGLAKSIAPDTVNYRDQTKPLRSNTSYESGEVDYKGSTYRWLGQQWGLKNPATGKFVPAPKAMQDQLNIASRSGSELAQRPTGNTTSPAPAPAPAATNVDTSKIQPVPKLGAPTSVERDKLQQKIDAALKAQGA